MVDASLVELVVDSVRVHMLSNRHVVILKETDRDRYLPIWIGQWEASAIAMKLQGLTPERPLTHDLFVAALAAVGARVDRVVVVEMSQETYHARLVLAAGDRLLEVDARPSDALALAVRTGARIFATVALMGQAGLGEGSPGLSDDMPGADRPLEAPGGGPADPRLDMFRDFVNSLDTDPGGEGQGRAS
jgi:bifunctional DNase/RNase